MLDVGCGSGRDAAWLAQAGYAVTAVEPDERMRAEVRSRHGDGQFRLRAGSLPGLDLAAGARFDFILANGLWMFIDPSRRAAAAAELAALLSARGVLAVTLRHPVDEGRGMVAAAANETIEGFARAGLSLLHTSQADDLQRAGISWHQLALQAGSDHR